MRTVYTCPECGCRDIHYTAWLYVNPKPGRSLLVENVDPPTDGYHCPDCDEPFGEPVEIEEDDVEGVVHSTDCMLGLDCTCGVASD